MHAIREIRHSAGPLHRFDRWMYRSGGPNRVARVLNRISAVQFSAGFLAPDRWAALEVTGRRTGRLVSFPVVVADFRGERYLVSMLGERANWVHNVRAAGGRAVLRHGSSETVRLVEVEPGLRAPILRRYLALAPGARAHVPVDRHAPVEAFEPIAAQFPVFRVTAAPAALPPTRAKDLAGRFLQVWGQGSLDLIDELAAPGLSVYYPLLGSPLTGREAFRRLLTAYRAAFPDAAVGIDEQLAEDDTVAVRWTWRGTHTGDLTYPVRVPATGRQITITGITLYRIADGRIAEERGEEDMLGGLQQIGLLPAFPAADA